MADYAQFIRTRPRGLDIYEHIASPRHIAPLLERWSRTRQEHFIVVTLNCAYEPVHVYCATKGLATRTCVSPREVFWYAIRDNASAVVVAHNHPSGRVEPSPEDIDITRRLSEAGEVLGIPVIDHLVFGRERGTRALVWHSMVEHGEYPVPGSD